MAVTFDSLPASDFVERMLERLPAGAYTCDPEGLITWYNDAAVRLWGREPKCNDPSDRFCGSFRLYDAEGAPVAHDQCWMARVLQEERAYEGCEIQIERPTGERVHVLAHANPIYDDSGKLLGAVNVLVDITDRKRAESILRDADQRKNEFLSMLAHELRNPLAPIRNAVALLRVQGPPEPKLQRARDLIDRQVGHMSRLLDDLLDLARISRGKLTVRPEPLELGSVLKNAVETARPLIDDRAHELHMQLPDEALRTEGDPVRLSQVFSNLLTNAARYTPPGGRLELVAEPVAGGPMPRLRVVVRDDGRGIPRDDLERIFEMFARGESAESEGADSGLGLGLTVVSAPARRHRGGAVATSEGRGRGSEFVVELPVSVGAEIARESRPEPGGPARRVLIVDDNLDAAVSTGMLLESDGHEVCLAHGGHQALHAAERFRPEVVLLDIGMPDMDGFEVCRRLRREAWGRDMTVVAVTGWGDDEHRRLSREAGFDEHLTKPVSPERMQELLTGQGAPERPPA